MVWHNKCPGGWAHIKWCFQVHTLWQTSKGAAVRRSREKGTGNSQASTSGIEEYQDILDTVAVVPGKKNLCHHPPTSTFDPEARAMAHTGLTGSNREITSNQGEATKLILCTEAFMQARSTQVDETKLVYLPMEDAKKKPSTNKMIYLKIHIFETNNTSMVMAATVATYLNSLSHLQVAIGADSLVESLCYLCLGLSTARCQCPLGNSPPHVPLLHPLWQL